ncbi:MAG: type IV conjugative transfer system protein TraL [Nitrospirae bacterium]|jgi:conjugal transfer pilus assembly protein TraL|nr:type IV conjugative transfer system protein TraL [Nitrospiraceae bacterium]MCX5727460.1 type IV conjugative transfer system protein TraL [Nitrospirota bacterium]NOS83322.1 type IV conjugative transfer system protein TraL [Nitrospira sp.]
MAGTFIPRYLDNLPQFLWWEADEMAIIFVAFIVGILSKQLTLFMGVALVCAYLVGKSKMGKSEGFILHWAYWYGVPTFRLKYAPDGPVRELVE